MSNLPDPLDPLNPPDSPPAAPVIPEGLATKVGKYGGAVLAIVALVAAVLDGDHTEETIGALLGSVVLLVRMMDGRYKQAAAIYESAPKQTPLVGTVSESRSFFPVEPDVDLSDEVPLDGTVVDHSHEARDIHDAE